MKRILLCFLLMPTMLEAGPYLLAGYGLRYVSNSDANDYFKVPGFTDPNFPSSLGGNWSLAGGWHFGENISLEMGFDGGTNRKIDYTFKNNFGPLLNDVIYIQTKSLFITPIATIRSKGFGTADGLHSVGLKIKSGWVEGTDTVTSYLTAPPGSGTSEFSGTATNWGLLYRYSNIYKESGFVWALEIAYDVDRFDNLVARKGSGISAGSDGQSVKAWNGGFAFIDASGPSFRLQLGWASPLDGKERIQGAAAEKTPAKIVSEDIGPEGAALRSALLPGWGHYSTGRKTKGIIVGASTLALFASTWATYYMAESAANQYFAYGAGATQDEFDRSYNDWETWANTNHVLAGFFVAAYVYNVIDAYSGFKGNASTSLPVNFAAIPMKDGARLIASREF